MIDTMTKSNFGRKGLFRLKGYSLSLRESEQELEAGTATEAMEECCLLIVPHGLFSLLAFVVVVVLFSETGSQSGVLAGLELTM